MKSYNFQGEEVNIIWLDEEDNTFPDGVYEISGLVDKYEYDEEEHRNDGYSDSYIKELKNKNIVANFVDQQEFFSINLNGKIERNVIANEFSKFCYENKLNVNIKRDDLVEMVKYEYWVRSDTNLSKKDFFESLKPQKFKYKW